MTQPARVHTSSAQRIQLALRLQQNGNLAEAKAIYCDVLESEPSNADAWHLLGMTLYAAGQAKPALDCLDRALELAPGHPDLLANQAVICRALGQLEQALALLRQALAIAPDAMSARINFGTVLLESGHAEQAIEQFRQVLATDPNHLDTRVNLANAYLAVGSHVDAEQLYRELLLQQPGNVVLLSNLGSSLFAQAQWEDAERVLRQAIAGGAQAVETHLNLGRVFLRRGRIAEAQQVFQQLIDQQPNLAKAHHYLGRTWQHAGNMERAAQSMERCLELNPQDVFARNSLGFVYVEQGRIAAAIECMQAVLRARPNMSETHSCLLFMMGNDSSISPEQLFREHQRWGQLHGNVAPLRVSRSRPVKAAGRLRIGYVSPDLRRHAVAAFFRPVMESHDHDEFEIFCYSETTVPDDMTQQLRHLSDSWRATSGLSNEQVAALIGDDEIDILVDLAGHSAGNRLKSFAYRPAPVQVTWLGYPNTTGLSAIDYRLTCSIQNPEGEPSYHSEELVRMAFGSHCFSAPRNAPPASPPPSDQNGFITFGSLHRPVKITSASRLLWSQVLRSHPTSRMVIFNTRFTEESAELLLTDLESLGVSRDRLEVRSSYAYDSYLSVYDEIDIALDVGPWSGGTTTLEALWMGVAVVALYGDRRSARGTAATLHHAGLGHWVARSPEEYVMLASQLVYSPDTRRMLRQTLRATLEDTVCNGPRFTQELERVYRHLWKSYCDQVGLTEETQS